MEDSYKRFSGNIAQKAIIEREGKILMCRGVGDKVWELPGGRLHEGEVEELKWVSIAELKDLPMFDDGKEVLEALMKSR